jgi:hypothetical protein
MILDIPKKMFKLHTVVHIGEGEESSQLCPSQQFANLPPDASPFGRLGQSLKKRSTDVSS